MISSHSFIIHSSRALIRAIWRWFTIDLISSHQDVCSLANIRSHYSIDYRAYTSRSNPRYSRWDVRRHFPFLIFFFCGAHRCRRNGPVRSCWSLAMTPGTRSWWKRNSRAKSSAGVGNAAKCGTVRERPRGWWRWSRDRVSPPKGRANKTRTVFGNRAARRRIRTVLVHVQCVAVPSMSPDHGFGIFSSRAKLNDTGSLLKGTPARSLHLDWVKAAEELPATVGRTAYGRHGGLSWRFEPAHVGAIVWGRLMQLIWGRYVLRWCPQSCENMAKCRYGGRNSGFALYMRVSLCEPLC